MKKSLPIFLLITLFSAPLMDVINQHTSYQLMEKEKETVFSNLNQEISPSNGLNDSLIFICLTGCTSLSFTTPEVHFALQSTKPYLTLSGYPKKEFTYYRNNT
ncbi:MAG: hypothetical protein WCR56_01360 [Bacilli bacterium]|jgi:hypothetical protein